MVESERGLKKQNVCLRRALALVNTDLAYDEYFYARTASPQRSLLLPRCPLVTTLLSGVPRLQQCQGLRKGFSKSMACSVDNCDIGSGVVHPATDAYAGEAVEALKAGKVIAVPTDTLYGFACDAWIYEIKGRRNTSPLAICVGDVSDIARFAVTDHLPHDLLDSLLPGPVTVVLKRGESSVLERSLNPGFDSVGVRVPDCNFIRIISRGSGTALALTSANLSGQPSSVSIKDFENLWEHCAFVYDGGLLPSGRAGSTVVDLTIPHKYRILRPGSAKDETVAILEKHSFVEACHVLARPNVSLAKKHYFRLDM
ncbi:YrdC domain-containing protein, mitochondrial, partial [Mucuna pruriens]